MGRDEIDMIVLLALNSYRMLQGLGLTLFFFVFFSRQNRILSRKQILTYIGRVGPEETDYSA